MNSVLRVLHEEVQGKDENLVRLLIESGASIEMEDGIDGVALHHSVGCGNNTNMAQLLLDMGANIEATDFFGSTALHRAAVAGPECVYLCCWRGEQASK